MANSNYYVNRNAQTNGDHEVHTSGCNFMPDPENRISLGSFDSCREPVRIAKRDHYSQSNGCYYCCNECHTS